MYPIARAPEPACVPLIELELVFVIFGKVLILRVFAHQAVAHDERLHLGPHETAEGIFGRADDRLAANVETRIDQDRSAGALLERAK
jgi:hypothetical protein